jgi:hypothetical protein
VALPVDPSMVTLASDAAGAGTCAAITHAETPGQTLCFSFFSWGFVLTILLRAEGNEKSPFYTVILEFPPQLMKFYPKSRTSKSEAHPCVF